MSFGIGDYFSVKDRNPMDVFLVMLSGTCSLGATSSSSRSQSSMSTASAFWGGSEF